MPVVHRTAHAADGHGDCTQGDVAWNQPTRPNGEDKMMKNLTIAAMLACTALLGTGCAVSSGQSTVGEYVDDATITTRVKSRLAEDDAVAAIRIQVETLNGVVQLSGFAISEAERQRAARIAGAVPGVKQVQNSVFVQPPQS